MFATRPTTLRGAFGMEDPAVDEAARRRVQLRIVHAAAWAHYAGSPGSQADAVTRDAGARARARRPSVVVAAEVALRDPVPALLAEGDAAALLVLGSRAVKLLADSDVTAVPVVDDLDRPMSVVSEADLLRKSSAQADLSGRRSP